MAIPKLLSSWRSYLIGAITRYHCELEHLHKFVVQRTSWVKENMNLKPMDLPIGKIIKRTIRRLMQVITFTPGFTNSPGFDFGGGSCVGPCFFGHSAQYDPVLDKQKIVLPFAKTKACEGEFPCHP